LSNDFSEIPQVSFFGKTVFSFRRAKKDALPPAEEAHFKKGEKTKILWKKCELRIDTHYILWYNSPD